MIAHPKIDPVAVTLFGFDVHWYGTMYAFGFLIAWLIGRYLLKQDGFALLRGLAVEDVICSAALGVIIGGRLGYVLFYNPVYYAAHPMESFFLWQGGMSFHGGLLGVIAALWLLAVLHAKKLRATGAGGAGGKQANLPVFARLLDFAAVMTPPGLGLGRLGNFINGELPGRVTSPDLPWAMVFGIPDDLPRHPSQLYQLAIEGFILTALMLYLSRRARPPGWLAGAFLVGYAFGRISVEFFREPDEHLGLFFLQLSMGQLLSVPMLLLGMTMIYQSQKSRQFTTSPKTKKSKKRSSP